MLSSLQMRSMRIAMQEKLASRSTRGRNVEEMSAARWKQTAKDLPVVALGSGLGYASGRLLGDIASKHLLKGSPKTQKALSYAIPLTTSMLSATGTYALGHQRALMRQRRDEADMLSRFNKKKTSMLKVHDPKTKEHLYTLDRKKKQFFYPAHEGGGQIDGSLEYSLQGDHPDLFKEKRSFTMSGAAPTVPTRTNHPRFTRNQAKKDRVRSFMTDDEDSMYPVDDA